MNRITLCLITKGRPQYQSSLLHSFEKALEYDFVEIFIVLNGVTQEVKESFFLWGEKYPNQVKFETSEVNEPISKFWSLITSINSEWLLFPSDDDVINEFFFGEWELLEPSVFECSAITTQLNLIDEIGQDKGIIRKPSYSQNMSKIENAAKAFNECPFLWPGLIIRTDSLPRKIPRSRYVSDWWIGIHLIFSGKITNLELTVTNYRVHVEQESNLAPLGRKNYEGLVHLTTFIHSEVFCIWVKEQTEDGILEFLDFISKCPPLHGDPKFSSELVSRITSRLLEVRDEASIHLKAHFANALAHDVLLNSDQLKYFMSESSQRYLPNNCFNFKPIVSEIACHKIFALVGSGDVINAFQTLTVGCDHSLSEKSNIRLDCSNSVTSDSIIDQLLLRSTDYFESQNQFMPRTSPFEYKLIKVIRVLKTLSPRWLNSLLYRIFKR